MYTSPDEARSDLFLAGAVYVLGDLVLELLFQVIPLTRIPVLGTVLVVVLPFVTTGLVPLLLMRYRKEPLAAYGLRLAPDRTFWLGALIGAPLAVASLVVVIVPGLVGAELLPANVLLPAVAVGPGALLRLVQRFAFWLGLALLGVFATVKARDAFRAQYTTVREGMARIGRVLAVAAAVLSALLILAELFDERLSVVALVALYRIGLPVAVAVSVWLTYRFLRGPSSTTRAALLTPVVLFALHPFVFSFDSLTLVSSAWQAVLAAGVGLIVGALQESSRSGLGAFGLAIVIALFAGQL